MLKHPLLTGAAMIAATAALILVATKARADPPTEWVTELGQPVVVCDTREQTQGILDAAKKSANAMQAEYTRMLHVEGIHGGPACAYAEMPAFQAGENFDEGNAFAASGELAHVWLVHGGTSQAEFWFIWAEMPKGNPA